jgi:hypothetical protein
MNTYKASELIVLHLCAGRNRNGDPRRVYVLTHALDGFIDAVDEGYEGDSVVASFCDGDTAVAAELMARIATKIETSPSAYRGFLKGHRIATVPYIVTL